MVDTDRFIAGDASIRWRALFGFISGAVASAVGMGVAGTVFAVGDLFQAPFRWLGDFLARVVELWAGVGIAAVEGSWDAVMPLIRESGGFAIVVSVVIVLASWWIVSQGVRRIG